MRRDALFTTLHDQYNTFQSSIQDPNAFHHDVFEIASEASTAAEFHRLLAGRRDQRLRELNESLESASFEIIANPSLVGTAQWEYALQLFRTRSLDSLVRYFASYLPSDHPWHHLVSKELDAEIAVPKVAPSVTARVLFDDTILTEEPLMMSHRLASASLHHDHLPPSPRSLTTYSDDTESSSHHIYCLHTLTPARTVSFSDSEQGPQDNVQSEAYAGDIPGKSITTAAASGLQEECPPQFHDDDTSQSSGPDTPEPMSDAELDVAEVHDGEDASSSHQITADEPVPTALKNPNTTNPTNLLTCRRNETEAITNPSSTTTPCLPPKQIASCRNQLQSGFIVDASRASSPLPVSVRVRHRSVSPSRPWPALAHTATVRNGPAVGCVSGNLGRVAGRPSRTGRRYRSLLQHGLEKGHRSDHDSSDNFINDDSGSPSNSRHKSRAGIEKTPLSRPMRTRLRERRQATAGTTATSDQQRR